MHKLIKGLAVVSAALLAGCETAPPPPVAPVIAQPEPQPVPYRWTNGFSEKAHKAMVDTFGRAWLTPGNYVWAESVPKEGDPKIVVDLVTQTAYAYRGDVLVGAASISSAKTGMVTPLGFWKIQEKRPMYRSKKYGNAPMPFMQRIDEYGIAFHGGNNPGYPASHGCIRMPMKFAEKLYGLTKLGTEVVIEG
ncbi:L,D-transpeptidase family protein [Sphingomonas sp. SM33]|jgi:lipoprotein-anchoring transpeptidase ErfK/SrfK|uniref:L,D-transpeptidase family protein n=1 Tax=Sphingomonas telluris TaxID=2907998 RepID=A0ABS9VL12_9SPHN|nr:L,D-transpeptidase family protein [Sphingomonas telluris]MCH8615661.1 L,D-transpeptidase family protein [Sphingomonas telluris]